MGYPTICGQYIGAKVYNEAEGSSMARRGNTHHSDDPLSDDYLGVKGLAWQSVLYSLSLSQKDKHYIMVKVLLNIYIKLDKFLILAGWMALILLRN